MSGLGWKIAGGFALAIGALCLLGAMLIAAVAHLDESGNQDRDPWLLDPDRPDPDRSLRNAGLLGVASGTAAAGAVALLLGGLLVASGAVMDRDDQARRDVAVRTRPRA